MEFFRYTKDVLIKKAIDYSEQFSLVREDILDSFYDNYFDVHTYLIYTQSISTFGEIEWLQKKLIKTFGDVWKMAVNQNVTSDKIIAILLKNNQLGTQVNKLHSIAKIILDFESYNFSDNVAILDVIDYKLY